MEHRTPREILQGRIRNDKKGESWPKKNKNQNLTENCSVNAPEESLTLGCNKKTQEFEDEKILPLEKPKARENSREA